MRTDRYAAELPFPAYAFVPNRFPHPVTDPRGHSFGQSRSVPAALNPDIPTASREFLFAVDLFNAGFYWEAHEVWEELWIAAGRTGLIADFLKGLIKLAAAGVKAREGRAVGVQRHARRAVELFRMVRAGCPKEQHQFAGLSFESLIDAACLLAAQPNIDTTASIAGLAVIPCQLALELDHGPTNHEDASR